MWEAPNFNSRSVMLVSLGALNELGACVRSNYYAKLRSWGCLLAPTYVGQKVAEQKLAAANWRQPTPGLGMHQLYQVILATP